MTVIYMPHGRVLAIEIGKIDGNNLVTINGDTTVFVDDEYLAMHKPVVGGYFTEHESGHRSFCPAELFPLMYVPLPTR